MKNKNLIRFAQAIAFLPLLSGSVPLNTVLKNPIEAQIAFIQKNNVEAESNAIALKQKELILVAKAEAINKYFKEREMPLFGTGMKMVEEAEKNGLDWRLLPAIAVRESTGGKFACKNATYSSFGWGSCKINFDSHEENIEVVAKNLGGNNPNTARYYSGKTIKQILQAYNPPSVVPRYAEQVMGIMDAIGDEEVSLPKPLALAK